MAAGSESRTIVQPLRPAGHASGRCVGAGGGGGGGGGGLRGRRRPRSSWRLGDALGGRDAREPGRGRDDRLAAGVRAVREPDGGGRARRSARSRARVAPARSSRPGTSPAAGARPSRAARSAAAATGAARRTRGSTPVPRCRASRSEGSGARAPAPATGYRSQGSAAGSGSSTRRPLRRLPRLRPRPPAPPAKRRGRSSRRTWRRPGSGWPQLSQATTGSAPTGRPQLAQKCEPHGCGAPHSQVVGARRAVATAASIESSSCSALLERDDLAAALDQQVVAEGRVAVHLERQPAEVADPLLPRLQDRAPLTTESPRRGRPPEGRRGLLGMFAPLTARMRFSREKRATRGASLPTGCASLQRCGLGPLRPVPDSSATRSRPAREADEDPDPGPHEPEGDPDHDDRERRPIMPSSEAGGRPGALRSARARRTAGPSRVLPESLTPP